ncbi:hypothetical protein SCACP_37130 [Sporomusa carbonis]
MTAEQAEKANEHDDDNSNPPGTGNDGNHGNPEEAVQEKVPVRAPNQGTLILDATCTPADIHFPTDLGLINEARENLDEIIDRLHAANGRESSRPEHTDATRKPCWQTASIGTVKTWLFAKSMAFASAGQNPADLLPTPSSNGQKRESNGRTPGSVMRWKESSEKGRENMVSPVFSRALKKPQNASSRCSFW